MTGSCCWPMPPDLQGLDVVRIVEGREQNGISDLLSKAGRTSSHLLNCGLYDFVRLYAAQLKINRIQERMNPGYPLNRLPNILA